MTEQEQESAEREVAAYLEQHPEFFVRHEPLLATLTLPHSESGTVSLVERQIQLLREKNRELERQLQQLARMARGNELLLERLQSLILKLVHSRSLDEAFELLDSALREDFHADFVTLRLFGDYDHPEAVATDAGEMRVLAEPLARRRPICGYLAPEQKSVLFGTHANEVASAILLPLCASQSEGECIGVLALGSVDPKRYHPEMGTVFVGHLGAVATGILQAHLRG